jgi:hypothetical protein
MDGILNIIYIADEDGSRNENLLEAHTMQAILNSVDAALSYEAFYQSELQTIVEQKELILNVSSLLFSFCEVVTDSDTYISLGQPAYASVQARLQVRPVVISLEFSPLSAVYLVYEAVSLYIPDLNPGAYCVVSYSLKGYETRMAELLEMRTFSVVPGPYVNGTGEIASGHFIVDIAASTAVEKVDIEVFNITCKVNETTDHSVPCHYFSAYDVLCPGEEGAWEFVCPKNAVSNMTCNNLISLNHSNSTSVVVETCEVKFATNSSMTCVCERYEELDYGSRYVLVEFKAMMVFVVGEFAQTWTSIHSLRDEDLEQGWKHVTLILVIIGVVCLSLRYVDSVDAYYAKEFLRIKKKHRPLKRFSQVDTEDSSFMQQFANVDMLFPEVVRDHSLFSVFAT